MATSKIHVMFGQALIDGPCSLAYLTANQDPRELWYAAAITTAVWNIAGAALVAPYSPAVSNNWKNGAAHAQLGTHCGPDLTFMRDVSEAEPSDVHCLVKASGNGVLRAGSPTATERWDKAGADLYAQLAPQVTLARAALVSAVPANPVEIGSITICLGAIEAGDYTAGTPWTVGAANFSDDVELLIGNIRTDLAAITGQTADDIPVILWRLPAWQRVSGGGSYADIPVDLIRNACLGLQVLLPNVRIADMDATAFTTTHIYNTAAGTIEAGEALFAAYLRLTDTSVPAAVDGGIPVIVYTGQSNVAGTTPALFLNAFYNGDAELTQDWTDKAFTYDWGSDEVEVYDPEVNSNSGPDPAWNSTGHFGPDVGMVPGLVALHASTGIVLFKLGVNSSSLGVNSTSSPIWLSRYQAHPDSVWPTYVAGWRSFVRKVIDATGRVPHTRLIIVHRGEADTEQGLDIQFEDNLREHIAELRALHAIDTHSADTIPVAIVKTKNITGNPWPVDGLTAVRAAQVAVAADEGNFLVDVDATASRADHIHDSGEGSIDIGRAIVAALPAWYDSGDPGE